MKTPPNSDIEVIRLRGVPLRSGAQSLTSLAMIDQRGTLPTDADALAAINALLPSTGTPLTTDDVYIHAVEAVNNAYLSDRYAFIDKTTIANVAADAAVGFAFMNMHRTGGWASDGELPYGRTFAGQYQQGIADSGQIVERALVSLYMLRDHQPNGATGINTDQMQKSITGGTVFDVSVGIYSGAEGQTICNVCRLPYRNCVHWRGYNDNMTLDEQIYARDVLGVPGGVATVSFVNWRCNEISAVYDGACAGAGF